MFTQTGIKCNCMLHVVDLFILRGMGAYSSGLCLVYFVPRQRQCVVVPLPIPVSVIVHVLVHVQCMYICIYWTYISVSVYSLHDDVVSCLRCLNSMYILSFFLSQY